MTMRSAIRSICAATCFAGLASTPQAQPVEKTIIQIFDMPYEWTEYRMPDIFMAGYEGIWHPPVDLASNLSVGYDPFDRMNLGSPNNPTAYGTEEGFQVTVDSLQKASVDVYIDILMNHNGGRNGNRGFLEDGGWPGFYIPLDPDGSDKVPGENWGDFHDGTTQSENPSGPNYNLFEGDLVSLIDIDQTTNYQMVRHPVDDSLPEFDPATDGQGDRGGGDPANLAAPDARRIPEGNLRNIPDPDNARLYPDRDLTPKVFTNPRTGQQFEIYPFNTADPLAGDPIMENATGLLLRQTQKLLDVYGVDGFRLDAAKHTQPFFWDEFWDAYVFDRRQLPQGGTGTAYSFGESVASNEFVVDNYVRIDGFGFRDALDISGAGTIRNVISGRGFGDMRDFDRDMIDAMDDSRRGIGFDAINGSAGVKHIYSHDNGTFGDGGSRPNWPSEDTIAPWAHAGVNFMPGPRIIYYNGRAFHDQSVNRFWPREGSTTALGYGGVTDDGGGNLRLVEDDRIPEIVRLARMVAIGEYQNRWEDADIFAYSRGNNCVVMVTDTYGSNALTRTFPSSPFAPGTILRELTGNAIPGLETITVGAGGSMTVTVPTNAESVTHNGNTYTYERNSGYVVYAPALPTGTLTIDTGSPAEIVPPDPALVLPSDPGAQQEVPVYTRRLTEVQVVRSPTFTIELETTQTDPNDPDTDDFAAFRINRGWMDLNASPGVDITTGRYAGYEGFDTQSPLYPANTGTGTYTQTINTADLPEGYNYISVVAFKHRPGGDPLVREWRKVIYVDTKAPEIELTSSPFTCDDTLGSLGINNPDGTADTVHVFINDPFGPLNSGNRALQFDRLSFVRGFTDNDVTFGTNTANIAVIERIGSTVINTWNFSETFELGPGRGDIDADSDVDVEDLYAFEIVSPYDCVYDVDENNAVDAFDRVALRDLVRTGEPAELVSNR